mmetsp:Transcript_78687/g.218544  ORF Transcript_78687/g.218544 Transcript_78687/m.218544 type:complete len:205 (+) Transcript_78687:3060-3674(+)
MLKKRRSSESTDSNSMPCSQYKDGMSVTFGTRAPSSHQLMTLSTALMPRLASKLKSIASCRSPRKSQSKSLAGCSPGFQYFQETVSSTPATRSRPCRSSAAKEPNNASSLHRRHGRHRNSPAEPRANSSTHWPQSPHVMKVGGVALAVGGRIVAPVCVGAMTRCMKAKHGFSPDQSHGALTAMSPPALKHATFTCCDGSGHARP